MRKEKIKIAFIKLNGLAIGGSELWHQKIATNLPKDKFEIDYYYSDNISLKGTDYTQKGMDESRLKYMQENNVNLIKFNVESVDVRFPYSPWINTDFWSKFDPKKYDLVHTAKAGPKEYPFYLINLPIVEVVCLANRPDNSSNIAWSFHPSEWQRNVWINKGGNIKRSSVLPAPIDKPLTQENYRKELNIPEDAIVAGFHQRADDSIWSYIPLEAFSKCQNDKWHFIIKNGSNLYKKQAEELKLKNMHFLPADGDNLTVSKFLNTLDFLTHGRKDGETFGNVLAEALVHGKPCLSHYSEIANAQKDTMGKAGLFSLNLEDYTKNLYSLFNDKKLRERLSQEAKTEAQKYDIKNTINTIIPIYNEILSDPSRFKCESGLIYKIKDFCFSYAVFYFRLIRKYIKK